MYATNGRGNLVVVANCDIPKKLSPEAKEALGTIPNILAPPFLKDLVALLDFSKSFWG